MNGLVAVVLIIVQNESKRKASEHFESSHLCSSVSRCLYSTQKIKFSIKNLFIQCDQIRSVIEFCIKSAVAECLKNKIDCLKPKTLL